MKKVLAVVFAVALVSFGAISANAQVPNLQVYFSINPYTTQADCPAAPPGTVPQTLYVVVNNFANFLSAIEYQVLYPPALAWLSDNSPAPLNIGVTPTGVASAFPAATLAFDPLVVMEVLALWMCDDCGGLVPAPQPLQVVANPLTVEVTPVGTTWPNQAKVALVGMTSLICPFPIAVEESTWGKVKSLYTD